MHAFILVARGLPRDHIHLQYNQDATKRTSSLKKYMLTSLVCIVCDLGREGAAYENMEQIWMNCVSSEMTAVGVTQEDVRDRNGKIVESAAATT